MPAFWGDYQALTVGLEKPANCTVSVKVWCSHRAVKNSNRTAAVKLLSNKAVVLQQNTLTYTAEF